MIFTCAPENEKRDGVDYRDVQGMVSTVQGLQDRRG